MALRFRGLDAPIEVQYWKGGKAPVPDPVTSINAQANANRYNIVGPSGSQTWSKDPSGQATQTVSLNPSEQKQYDLRNQIAETMLGGSQGQIKDLTDTPFEYDTSGFDSTPFSFDQATPAAAKASYDRQSALLKPEFDNADREFEQRMANAGVPLGSEAYNDALRQHENDKNFALTDAARAADTIGSQLALSERQQRTSEAGSKADRSLSQRQQRVNEMARVLGEGEVAPVGAYGQSGSPIDVSGAYDAQNEANLANYNAGVQGNNALLGTIGQLGAAGLGAYSNYKSNQRTSSPPRPSAAGGEAATAPTTNLGSIAPSSSGQSYSTLPYNDSLNFGANWNGMNDADLSKSLGTTGAMKAIDDSGGLSLGEIGKGAGSAYNIYSGLQEGGATGYAKAAGGAASLAGYDVPALGYVGAAQQALKGDVPGAAVSAISTYLPVAGLGFAAAGLANKSINAKGDEKRNLSAFLTDNPLGIQGMIQPQGNKAAGFMSGWLTGDGKVLQHDYMEKLAGAYYGSRQGDSSWTKQYQDLLANPVYATMPKGVTFHDGHYYMGDRALDTYLNGKKV